MKSPLLFALFLTAFFAVFTLLHWFFWRGLNGSFTLPKGVKWGILAFFVIMYLFPIVTQTHTAIAASFPMRGVAWIGYLWLGFLFYFLFIGGTFELVAFALRKFAHEDISRRVFFLITVTFCVAVIVYGFYEAAHIKVRHLSLTSEKLPEFVTKIRMVQVSDVHFSQLHGVAFAEKLTKLIKEQEPDAVLLTGDFLDRGMVDEEGIAALWRDVKPPLGKYACTGNHEFYNGIQYAEEMLTKSGFTLLRNRGETRANAITIAGVDDPTAARFGDEPPPARAVLEPLPHNIFTVLLKHQPTPDPDIRGLFDLQLSGHTHNGQMWPFSWFVSLIYPMRGGFYKQEDGAMIAVSSGAGTWGPPIRVFAPPDIVVIDLVRQLK